MNKPGSLFSSELSSYTYYLQFFLSVFERDDRDSERFMLYTSIAFYTTSGRLINLENWDPRPKGAREKPERDGKLTERQFWSRISRGKKKPTNIELSVDRTAATIRVIFEDGESFSRKVIFRQREDITIAMYTRLLDVPITHFKSEPFSHEVFDYDLRTFRVTKIEKPT